MSEWRAVPDELRDRAHWLTWDPTSERKQPYWGAETVSWSDPDEWHGFGEAVGKAGERDEWGIGYVCAAENDDAPMGVISIIDLDGAADADDSPKEWLPSLKPFIDRDCYIEWSPSHDKPGDSGLHIPIAGTPPKWWSDVHKSDEEHEGVDVLSNKFSTVTGDRMDVAGQKIVTWGDWTDEWLADAYEALTGETAPPRRSEGGSETSTADGAESYDEEWLDEDTVGEALDAIDANCSYSKWRNIGFGLADHFSEHTAKHLFDTWSRNGSKYDEKATELIDDIAGRGSGGVTIGTVIHHAKEAGWEPDFSDEYDGTPSARELVAKHSDEYDSVEEVPEDVFATDVDEEEGETDGENDSDDIADNGSNNSTQSTNASAWDNVVSAYRAAENADETLPARFEATKQLMTESYWRTIIENDSLWQYDQSAGIYRPEGEERLRERLVEKLQEQYKANELREIASQIRGRTTVREEDFGGPDGYIATENCVIELNDGNPIKHEHDPEYEFIGRVQTDYDPSADCPRFKEFLKESVDSREARQTLQEYAGYSLMHWKLPHHKALFLVGPTASGKSTFLDTVRAMIGNDSTASLTPQQMTSERFGGAELYGTWANIRNDIPASVIEDTGQFKEIVAGDPIKAEEKYQDPFSFEPTAKHMFSANQLPDADTDDEAFFRRILLISFPSTVPRDERDPKLDDKLQAELPGVLNWALEGLERLMETGSFSLDRSPGETQKTWQEWGNSCERFANVCLEDDDADKAIPKKEIYQAYLAFCDDEGIPSESQHMLTRELKQQGFNDGKEFIDGRQQRAFHGVAWTGRGEQYRDADCGDESATGGGGIDKY